MRIRTDGDYSWRVEHIERAAEFYDRNKTASVVAACEDVPELAARIEDVLEREDLTFRQRCEIAETLSTRYIEFGFEVVDGDLEAIVDVSR
jgi:hypothetical protein